MKEIWILTHDSHSVVLWLIFYCCYRKFFSNVITELFYLLEAFSLLRSCIIVDHCGNGQNKKPLLFLSQSIVSIIVSGSETLSMIR